jgi:hypothetical protein
MKNLGSWSSNEWMKELIGLSSLAFPPLRFVQRATHGFGLGRPVRLDPVNTAPFCSRQQTGYLEHVRS